MPTVRATLMRGGTSKCWIFDSADVPDDPTELETLLVSAFGAADVRQIDGVGGASSTTSKAAVVRAAGGRGNESRVEYLFAQVAIGESRVEWGSNCGNCATAVGLYALQAGLVEATARTSVVQLRNLNTGGLVEVAVPTPGGVVPEFGDAVVPGVVGTGVPVGLTFVDPHGANSGRLLPTGNPVDLLRGDGAAIPVTIIDAATIAAVVDAGAIGASGAASLAEVDQHVPTLTALRRRAAIASGLASVDDPVSHAVPKVGFVASPTDYVTTSGTHVAAGEFDLAVRMLSMHAGHPVIGLTSAAAIATATCVDGTVPARRATAARPSEWLRLGTAGGVVTVELDRTHNVPRRVTLQRSARRIATAEIYLPRTMAQDRTAALEGRAS